MALRCLVGWAEGGLCSAAALQWHMQSGNCDRAQPLRGGVVALTLTDGMPTSHCKPAGGTHSGGWWVVGGGSVEGVWMCWVLGAGCWVLGAGCWVCGGCADVLGAGCWVCGGCAEVLECVSPPTEREVGGV